MKWNETKEKLMSWLWHIFFWEIEMLNIFFSLLMKLLLLVPVTHRIKKNTFQFFYSFIQLMIPTYIWSAVKFWRDTYFTFKALICVRICSISVRMYASCSIRQQSNSSNIGFSLTKQIIMASLGIVTVNVDDASRYLCMSIEWEEKLRNTYEIHENDIGIAFHYKSHSHWSTLFSSFFTDNYSHMYFCHI